MKIIDLLNKIANGEEVPKKIITGSEEYVYFYDSEVKDYRNVNTEEKLFESEIGKYIKYYLNDEVEIPEESQEHKIPEKLDEELASSDDMLYKINEILDYLEELK